MTATWPTTPDTLIKPTSGYFADNADYMLDVELANYATLIERLESVASGELFINGNYDWWQRIESGSVSCPTAFSAISSFGPDRIFTLPAGANVVVNRSATVGIMLPKSRWCATISGAASVAAVDHGQRIRSDDRVRYKQPLVFSALIYNQSGANYAPTLRIDTPAAADDWTTPTNRGSLSLQTCVNNVVTPVSVVFDPSAYTNIDNGLSVYIRIPSGSATAGKITSIAQMSLRPGVAAVPYLPPDVFVERLRCLPYYRKSYEVGTVLQTNTTTGLVGAAFVGSGATNVYVMIPLTPPMWKAPTIRLWDKAGTAAQFYKYVAATNHAAAAAAIISSNGFQVSNSSTATEDMWVHYDAVSELT